jgi:hypothetical protein
MANRDIGKLLREYVARQRAEGIGEEFRAALSEALGTRVRDSDFADRETTTALRNSFFERVKITRPSLSDAPPESLESIYDSLRTLAAKIPPTPIVLFHSEDWCLGGVQLDAATVLANAPGAWDVAGPAGRGDLCLVTPDLKSGLCLEVNYIHLEGSANHVGVYELRSWGVFGTLEDTV